MSVAVMGSYYVKAPEPFSEIGRKLERQFEELYRDRENTISLGWRAVIRGELEDVAENCSSENWDGYGASPITQLNLDQARVFIKNLPEGILPPEVTPSPDGAVAFDWMKKNNHIMSISVENGRLIYAVIIGEKKNHEEIPFYEELPEEVSKLLKSYFKKRCL